MVQINIDTVCCQVDTPRDFFCWCDQLQRQLDPYSFSLIHMETHLHEVHAQTCKHAALWGENDDNTWPTGQPSHPYDSIRHLLIWKVDVSLKFESIFKSFGLFLFHSWLIFNLCIITPSLFRIVVSHCGNYSLSNQKYLIPFGEILQRQVMQRRRRRSFRLIPLS